MTTTAGTVVAHRQKRERLAEAVRRLPRVALGQLPTPLHELRRLSATLGGPRIFIKRDDLTGLGMGGNKVRLLEFYVADALARQADVLVTGAAVQSNLCRQTAAAAARCGLRCVLLLRGAAGAEVQGNLLLDHLFGAEVRPVQSDHLTGIWDRVTETAEALRAAGHRPYAITTFDALAGVAYVDATRELAEQCEEQGITPTWIVTSAAGATQSGLVLGAQALGAPWRVLGIAPIVWQDAPMAEKIAGVAQGTARLLGLDEQVRPEDIINLAGYIGDGYAIPSPEGLEAMRLMARTEGLVLDPVYTSKALAGLIDQVRRGVIGRDDVVVFLHTGGLPALFAFHEQIAAAMASAGV
jgi:D-cysteine desulfhydrase family pyridoxal phosphate-dependent enzyme